jgi:hypothetical protein
MNCMQTTSDWTTRWKWVDYAAFDAKATWDLFHSLREKLQATECHVDEQLREGLTENRDYSQWDLYLDVIRPFGDILTCMESVRPGMQSTLIMLSGLLYLISALVVSALCIISLVACTKSGETVVTDVHQPGMQMRLVLC